MKKFISILSCGVIISSGFNVSVFADEGNQFTTGFYDCLKYRKYSDYIEIGACDDNALDETMTVVIPSEIEDLPVKSIGYSAFEKSILREIVLPETIESIGGSAFKQSRLQHINIPGSVTSIGSQAFTNCNYITEIIIPDSVIKLGSSSFSSCSQLTTVMLSNNLTEIEYGTFFYSDKLQNIIIPESVNKICAVAFQHCDSLTEITIPESVTLIEEGAFGWCENLNSITILNPECDITKSYFDTRKNGFWGTIYGYESSTAQKFAESKNCNFEIILSAQKGIGDVNEDGTFDVADVVMLQKWLLGSGMLTNWKAADLNDDEIINIFDLVLMKRKLLGTDQRT